ncbi:MAG: VTT domain-containing protein [Chloroflexi bacterium]|nr:VTT domain-containing protein [Chloroflexota bacterium]
MSQEDAVKPKWGKKDFLLGVVAILATIAVSVAGILYKDELMGIAGIGGYSLLGMLIISFAAGSILSLTAVPVPYWLLVFTLPTVLAAKWGVWAPVGVGLISALGTTLGHMPTFMIGYGGSRLTSKVTSRFENRYYTKAIGWTKQHGAWASFLISAMFNPLHLPMTIAIGALRFPPPKFFFFSLLGNAVKSLTLAFAGYFGLNSLLRFLGL